MPINSTQPPSIRPANPEILPATEKTQPTASRSRFELYRQKVRRKWLFQGGMHSSSDSRDATSPVRSAKQLVWQFFQLLAPFRRQVFWILASATVATLIGLLPPAGTKFIIDYGLSGKHLPEPWLRRFPSLADPRRLLLVTVIAVALTSFVKILVHI